jgi:hypothetical protein
MTVFDPGTDSRKPKDREKHREIHEGKYTSDADPHIQGVRKNNGGNPDIYVLYFL